MEKYSIENLPDIIAAQETVVSNARTELGTNKLILEVEKAKLRLRFALARNLSESVKQSQIIIDTEAQSARILELEAQLRIAEIEFNRLVNTFLALRKQSNLRVAEIENL